jgi:hypothetical protein
MRKGVEDDHAQHGDGAQAVDVGAVFRVDRRDRGLRNGLSLKIGWFGGVIHAREEK